MTLVSGAGGGDLLTLLGLCIGQGTGITTFLQGRGSREVFLELVALILPWKADGSVSTDIVVYMWLGK